MPVILAIDVRLSQSFFTGMLASVNPCGFVLLPTYLLYFLGINSNALGSQRATVHRALLVGSAVSLGFITVFTIIGIISRALTTWLSDHAEYAGLVIGLLMVALGVAMLAGYRLPIGIPRLQAGGTDRTVGSMYLYGIGYAVASIGCSFPLFSSVVLGTVNTDGLPNGIAAVGLYGAGMGLVVIALTVTLAIAETGLLRVLRASTRYLETASAVVVLFSGLYLSWYWFSVIRDDLPRDRISTLQERVQNWLYENQSTVGWTFAAIVAAALAFVLLTRRVRNSTAGSGDNADTSEPPVRIRERMSSSDRISERFR